MTNWILAKKAEEKGTTSINEIINQLVKYRLGCDDANILPIMLIDGQFVLMTKRDFEEWFGDIE